MLFSDIKITEPPLSILPCAKIDPFSFIESFEIILTFPPDRPLAKIFPEWDTERPLTITVPEGSVICDLKRQFSCNF